MGTFESEGAPPAALSPDPDVRGFGDSRTYGRERAHPQDQKEFGTCDVDSSTLHQKYFIN